MHLPAGVSDGEAKQATLKALELGVAQLNVALEAPLVGKELPLNPELVSKEFVRPRRVDHGEVALDLSENTLVIAGDEAWEVPGLEDVLPSLSRRLLRRITRCTRWRLGCLLVSSCLLRAMLWMRNRSRWWWLVIRRCIVMSLR